MRARHHVADGAALFPVLILALLAAPAVAWWLARHGGGVDVSSPWATGGVLLLAAVVEEIVFRAGLQRWLRHRAARWRGRPLSLANLAVGVLFAALHGWRHPAWLALGVLPVALFVGWVYEAKGERLRWPIALHAWFNLSLLGASLAVQ